MLGKKLIFKTHFLGTKKTTRVLGFTHIPFQADQRGFEKVRKNR